MANAPAPTLSCFIVVELHIGSSERAALPVSKRGPTGASIVPDGRHPPKGLAVDRHMADGRERHMRGHQQLTVRRQLPQQTDAGARRLLGVVFEAVVPLGVFEPDREHEVAGERQPVAAGCNADYAVSGGVATGTTDPNPRRHLALVLERPKLAAVLLHEAL